MASNGPGYRQGITNTSGLPLPPSFQSAPPPNHGRNACRHSEARTQNGRSATQGLTYLQLVLRNQSLSRRYASTTIATWRELDVWQQQYYRMKVDFGMPKTHFVDAGVFHLNCEWNHLPTDIVLITDTSAFKKPSSRTCRFIGYKINFHLLLYFMYALLCM